MLLVDVLEFSYYLIIFCLGLSLGSFMNSWVWRTRENLGLTRARAMCPKCRYVVRWYDNIPLLSFILLGGRCRNCERRIIWQYPLVELWGGIMLLGVTLIYGLGQWVFSIELVRDWTILMFLTFIFIYDRQYREILNFPTLVPGIGLFLASIGFGWQSLSSLLLGVIIGAGFFFILYIISKGAWISGGDVRLGLFMGVILGWPKILLALLFSYVMGAIVSLILVGLGRQTLKSQTPFGTYLVMGTVLTMFLGDKILGMYMGWV